MKTTRPIFLTPAKPFTTARLLIRPMTLDDLEDLHKLRTQQEVMRWTSTGKCDPDRAFTQNWIRRFIPPNDATTFDCALEELENPGIVIGALGCHVSEPPEVGYMIRKEYWGKGYATEGLSGWLQVYWALPRKEVELEKNGETGEQLTRFEVVEEVLKAVIADGNVGSKGVLRKCGFVRISVQTVEENGEMVDLATYYLTRPK